MKQYSVAEARLQFADIIKLAEQGEEIVVTRHGKPVIKIERVKRSAASPGWATKEGWEIKIAGDFSEIPEGFEEYV